MPGGATLECRVQRDARRVAHRPVAEEAHLFDPLSGSAAGVAGTGARLREAVPGTAFRRRIRSTEARPPGRGRPPRFVSGRMRAPSDTRLPGGRLRPAEGTPSCRGSD